MLDDMDAPQLAEWKAFDRLQDKEYERAQLTARAEAGLKNYKRGGR
jgi:hypothetical protein